MTIVEIKNFLALAEYGSFTKAAQASFISQQALSKSISHLESYFGFPLFERSYHQITLTEKGEALYDFFSQAESDFRTLLLSFDVEDAPDMQVLRVGYAELLDMSLFMSRQLHAFQGKKELPMLAVERIEAVKAAEKLLHDELDICFCYPDHPPVPQIENFPVQRSEVFLCVSSNNPKVREGASYKDFLNETVYDAAGYKKLELYNRSGKYKHILELAAERDGLAGVSIAVHEVPTLESIITAVENGQGVAIFPGSNPLTQSKTIQTYPLGFSAFVHCIYNKRSQNHLVLAFVDHLKKQLKSGDLY